MILQTLEAQGVPVSSAQLAQLLGITASEQEGVRAPAGRDAARRPDHAQPARCDLRGHQARPDHRQRCRGIPTALVSWSGTAMAPTCFSGRRKCIRCCTATAWRCAKPASTAAAGRRRKSSKCWSAPTIAWSAGCTASAACCSWSPKTSASARTCWCPPGDALNAQPGQVVVAEIIEQPAKHAQPIARVVEVLGNYADPGMEIEIALRKHDLPHEFPRAVEKACEGFSKDVTARDSEGRADLRKLPLVTIDGETAKDFRRRGLLRAARQGIPAGGGDRRRQPLRRARRCARCRGAQPRQFGVFSAPRDPDAAGGACRTGCVRSIPRSTACAWCAT